ncbi:sulfatase family protein [Novosphingobium sediminicola]|uniref:Putative sulfatase n=1 Tax=Novosphingobium sediminicola TaxID=563162 RepID=A0A7W6CFN0_9SPHN|nr:sulfatase [Novosphingobium sediminicola]MBB3955651.1 putative sulfatase [Novosphingobium sediminicola]
MTHINRRKLLASSGLLAAGMALGGVAKAIPSRPPNIIVILCDDLGYGDVGPTGGRGVPTPHLDRMAAQGITLTDYYAPANVCTPSRAGLLTGRYPARTTLSRVLLETDTQQLPKTERTIAHALKPAYKSALIGKWHLGHKGDAWDPTNYGFDLFYGIPYSHDINPLRLYERKAGEAMRDEDVDFPRLQQKFYNRAQEFIEENAHRPFFLELALSSPHLPNFPAPGFGGKSQDAGAYGDTIIEIDSIVGRLNATLARLGLERDTLVIFTSDNGPWFEGSTGGLRQRKGGGAYDGAYRVPFIARWPGHIPAGRRSNAMAMGIDVLPTACALAGLPLPPGVEIDGRDISAVLMRGGASPHEELLLFQDENVVGIRTQRWKYVRADFYMNFLMPLDGRGYPQLYDMRDPTEQYSVASLHPDVTRAMQARMQQAAARFAPYRRTPEDPIAAQAKAQAAVRGHTNLPAMWQD